MQLQIWTTDGSMRMRLHYVHAHTLISDWSQKPSSASELVCFLFDRTGDLRMAQLAHKLKKDIYYLQTGSFLGNAL